MDLRPLIDRPPRPAYQPYQIVRRVFTAGQCDRIIALGGRLAESPAALADAGGAGVSDPAVRRSSVAWIGPDDASLWIYEKIAGLVERVNRRFGFELSGFEEDIQFTTYAEPGAFYSWHQDGLDGELANRKLSVVVQLSDPETYRGAELQLFEVAEDYDDDERDAFDLLSSERGAAVVFPSFEQHRVLPLRSGARHSLVCWVSGPPFR